MSAPDPTAVERGHLRLIAAVQPGAERLTELERAALRALLWALDSARVAAGEEVPPGVDPHIRAAAAHDVLLDSFARVCAHLGTPVLTRAEHDARTGRRVASLVDGELRCARCGCSYTEGGASC